MATCSTKLRSAEPSGSGRSTHGNENGLRLFDGRPQLGREAQAPVVHVGADHRGESGLVDRNLAALQRLDFVGVFVDTDHVHAEVGQAGAGDKTYIPATYYADFMISAPGCLNSERF